MNILDIVRILNERGIFPYVEDGKLKTRSDAPISDADVIDLIRSHRDGLIAFLADSAQGVGRTSAIVPIADRASPAPLSFAQQRLWFIDQLEGGSAQYNVNVHLALRGVLDLDALRRTIETIVARHESLRTQFVQGADGEVVQQPIDDCTAPLAFVDLESLSEEARTAAIAERTRAESTLSFDLGHPPLLRATVLRLSANEHVLLFVTHHIASDGWSKDVLVEEFCTLYATYRAGGQNPLPPLPVQYRDYAAWQREQLSGAALATQLAWWTARLDGLPPVHALPLSAPRPAQQRFDGGMLRLDVPADTVRKARALCAAQAMTPFVLMHAVFALLVARLSGESDVAVGTPVSGRVHPDLERLVGFFINTLVLRTTVDPSQGFGDYVAASKRDVLDAFNHQNLPFELLVDALNPERSLSYSPLFQLLFSFHSDSARALALPGLELEALNQADNRNQFDMEFNVVDDGDGIRLSLSYNRTLFDARAIEGFASAFCTLLAAGLDAPERAVAELALLDDAAQRRLLSERGGAAVAHAGDVSVHAGFAAIAAAHADAPAVIAADGSLTFRELDQAANRLAHYLVERGTGPGDRVGLYLKRVQDLPVALLAVLKAGAAYVPLALDWPEDRVRYVLDDAAIRLVLTQSELWDAMPFDDRDVLPIDIAAPLLAAQPDTAPALAPDAGLPAYVLYTSGSTGQPKGVAVAHPALGNYLDYVVRHYFATGAEGGVVATPFAFDATVTSLIAPWFAGRPAMLLDDETDVALEQLLQHMASARPLLFKLTPAHLDALAHLSRGPVSTTAHLLVVGGEQLTARTLERFRARVLPQAVVVNEYGPTETTVGCSTFFAHPDAGVADGDAVPIGRPIQNTRLYVLDARGQPVPDGVVGELHIGGHGVAIGYLNHAAATDAKFVADPFAGEGRMYRTGDLVRWRHDGELEFVGRVDDQVKLNGFRIELGEIESRLAAHADVEDACAVVREDGAGSKRLVAYVVPRASMLDGDDESEIERWRFGLTARLREAMRRALPDYMLPSAYVLLAALPLTANGKLDRAGLPAPVGADFEQETFAAPDTQTEAVLLAIWQHVLRLDAIGIDDHFFRIGGHSLLATRVVSEIAERLRRRVPVRSMFEYPTVRALAAHLDAQAEDAYRPIERVPREGPQPLSFGQQRLWFIDQLGGGSRQYHIASALRLQGALDRDALQRAIDAIVARHEILRSRFVSISGVASQVVDPPSAVAVRELDLSDVPADVRETRLPALIEAESGAPFDLARDPMLRVALARLGDDDHVVMLTMHHIASDGWSTSVLVREFTALYRAFQAGGDDPLAPLPIQYGDFVHWQRQALADDPLQPHLAYWREQLADLPRVHRLPLDRRRPTHQDYAGGAIERRIEATTAQALDAFAVRHDASLFMLLRAAFALLLARWSGETDIVIASPSAGRARRELEPLVGFFLNTLVLRTDLSGNPCFRALLAQVQRSTLDAFAHEVVPFDMLVDELKPERSLNHAPLAQISFTLHNLEDAGLELPGLRISDVAGGASVARHDLELHVFEAEGALRTRWIYATSLFDAATIARLADSFVALLDAALDAPDAPVMALPLLPAYDRGALARWSAPQPQPLPVAFAHQLFEAQAVRDPSAPAVAFDGETLSYGALDAAANRVAHWLRGQGVGPGGRVGLCVERSPDLLVGLLAVLKAGAAYVPLDPGLPPERLDAMLSTAGVALVLSQQSVLETLPNLGDYVVLPLDAQVRALLLAGLPATAPDLGSDSDGDRDREADHDDTRDGVRDADARAERAAYAIFTSGSTGTPKGVLCAHRGMVNLALYQQRELGVGPGSRVMTFASIGFDGAVFEWLMALASGGSLHICRDEDRKSAERLAAFLVSERITHGWIPPALLAQVPIDRDYALQVLIVAGEACEEHLAWRWAERCRVVNSYGPTEATVAATHADIVPGETIVLGHALPNVALRVTNAHGELQPIGVAGELRLGGAGLALGYLGQAELTAERFPAAADGTGREYRTGDLVRWNPDGRLQFLGRVDDQVKIRGFRVELGEVETHLLACADVRETVAAIRDDTGDPRLVAYVVCGEDANSDDEAVLAKTLREHMKVRVPDYMVPSAFVMLAAIPLTRNGKVDRRRLPKPNYEAQQAYVAPTGEVETRLVEIWQQVLRIGQIGVNDNFFEIGGDSILSIQVVSRANQAGIPITTKQLFETQTIAELAKVAATGTIAAAPQDAVEGALSLLPIHHLFLGAETRDPQHYNQAVLLITPAEFAPAALPAVIEALYRRHDALRLRFAATAAGWQAAHAPLDAAMIADSCVVEAMPAPGADFEDRLAERCTHWQRAFDLAAGPLLRAVYFQPRDASAGRLLLIVHHIVVDGVSWRILLSDLERAYGQSRAQAPIVLDAKTSSFQQWGDAMAEYARSPALHAERGYWLRQALIPVPPLPVDHRSDGFGAIATTQSVVIGLDEAQTRALLQRCNAAYRTQINELLLAGVYLGMRAWTGATTLRIRLEGHGREALFDHLDTTATVGWFTSVYPLTLSVAHPDVDAAIKAVKEQYRAIPHHGIGYGVLRHLADDAELVAADTAVPELEFNYLGQFDHVLNPDTAFQPAPEGVGEKISGRRQRMHRIGLSGKVFGGRLNFALDYSSAQYELATMERLAESIGDGLRRVIAHCLQREDATFTPSDFPLARVSQSQLDAWHGRHPRMARLYPATPMQVGLHFESQIEPSTYVVQNALTLDGALDAPALQRAWQAVVQRHDVLRTAFVEGEDVLHQLVSAQAVLPWHEEDWRALSAQAQDARFDAYRARDRRTGFDFAQPPLMRVALFRIADDRYRMLWTTHHIIVDGWSSPLIYREVIALYRTEADGRDAGLGEPARYERYIGWLQAQDAAAARAQWRRLLEDVEAPTLLPAPSAAAGGDAGPREHLFELGAAETAALHRLAHASRVTPNTLVQWAWAYLLHRQGGASNVVFGATISGRRPEVAGIEEMVGLFINTVPVPVAFPAGQPLQTALETLQRDFQAGSDHGHLPLLEIQRQSRLPAGVGLFDSLLVFENLPTGDDAQGDAMGAALQIEFAGSQRLTQYRLTLIATLDAQLRVRFGYRADQFDDAVVTRLARQFGTILAALPALAAGDIAAPTLLDDDERRRIAVWHAPARAYAQDATIHGLFEANADRDPDQVALIRGGERMHYGELERRANRVAHALRARGLGRGDAVALRTERAFAYVVGLLGVLKAGAAYVPIDPETPAARVAAMLHGSRARCLLTTRSLVEDGVPAGLDVAASDTAAPELAALDVLVLDDDDAFAAYPETRPQAGVAIDDPAFVMHTSGSTGLPKGVQLGHRTIVNLMTGMAARHPLLATPAPSLQFAAIGFDMSLYEVAGALFCGGPLVLLDDEERLDTRRLLAVLRRERVARAYLPTAMLDHFAQTALESGVELPDLRVVQVAGEQLVVSDALRTWAARHGCTVLNLYGPTESHVVSEHLLDGDPTAWPALPPIGAPVDNVVLQILDVARQPAPVGAIGELYIGGDGLAHGYVGQPHLTAERFVDLAVEGAPARRYYRSGDLARWRADGRIDYLGRADRQIKVRGFRVEPGEIEARLGEHPAVSKAVVTTLGEGAERQLVAYVAADVADDAALSAELRALLKRHLPHFMLPSAFMVLPALPLTANGKVDRRALPVPEWSGSPIRVEPSTETERRLAAIWQRLLGLDEVGASDRFFDLGGHSLSAMRLLSMVGVEFGCALKIKDVFAYPTVAELAQLIDALTNGIAAGDADDTERDDEALEETEW